MIERIFPEGSNGRCNKLDFIDSQEFVLPIEITPFPGNVFI